MKYMVHMIGKSKTTIEEGVIFGHSPKSIRDSEEYKNFQSDGYEEEAMFALETISGSATLPTYIFR